MDTKLYNNNNHSESKTLNVGAVVLSTPNSHHPNIGDLPNAPSIPNLTSAPYDGHAKSSLATIENKSIAQEDSTTP